MLPVKFFVIVLTTLSLFNSIHGQVLRQPGAKIQVSRPGLVYASQVAIDILARNLNNQNIPDLSGQANIFIGNVDYTISNINIIGFTKPSSTVTVNAGSGLTWTVLNADIKVNGNWRYEYKLIWFIKIKDSGSFDLSVSGASASVTVTMRRIANGIPSISMLSCSCTISKVDIKFHSGASWLYDIFSGFVERPLKSALQKEVCKAVEKTINVNAAAQLATFSATVVLNKNFVLDYSLHDDPIFATDYLQTSHKGEVFYSFDRTPAPFTGPYVPTPPPSRMLTAYVNEFVADSLGQVLHRNNILWYTLTKDRVPENARPYFATTCSPDETCFGTLFPDASTSYPNANLEFNMTTTVAPTMTITPQGVTGTITGRVQVYARLSSGGTGNLLSLAVTVTVRVTPSVQGNRVLATVTQLTPHVTVESSQIGDTKSEKSLNKLIMIAADSFIIPSLNEVGLEGLEIPNIKGVTFVGPTVSLTTGALIVSCDVSYVRPSGP